MDKWKDPRTPVSIEQIGKFTVTIYDQGLYDESLRLYPDDSNEDKLHIPKGSSVPHLVKKKSQNHYNWITRLNQLLKG